MKVLHFSSLDGHTGAGVAAARIHTGLLERGVRSRFCVAYPAAGLPQSFTPPVSRVGRAVRSLEQSINDRLLRGPMRGYDYVLSTGAVGIDMGRIIAEEQPDVVQLHWIAGTSFRLASLKGASLPIVWRLSDQWPFCGLQHLEPDAGAYAAPLPTGFDPFRPLNDLSEHVRLAKQAVYRTLPNLHLVAPSRWLATETGKSALLGDRPVDLIPTSCDTRLFSPKDKAACRAVLGLDPEAPLVLVGATSMGTRWKGMDLFVEAVAKLGSREAGRGVTVVTFGKDTLAAEALGGQVGVVHMGAVQDRRLMAILYAAADVFVSPSRMENLSNAVLESLACGTPVAAFDIGGMPDMIDHRINGWLAAPFDTDAMAEGVAWLLARRGDVAIRQAAHDKILSAFSLKQEIDGYLGLYNRMIEERRPKP